MQHRLKVCCLLSQLLTYSQVQVYIDLTGISIPRDAKGRVSVSSVPFPGALRRRLLALGAAPPITSSLPLDRTAAYKDVPHVVDVGSSVEFVGGINAPLVVTTVDSNGWRQRQLAKSGNDDLRQDAVMQQTFQLMNRLLDHDPDASQRRLRLRTYRVVPCSPMVGVLEWVEGTAPLGDWLASGPLREGGACARYRRPGHLSWYDCYRAMEAAAPDARRSTYLELLPRFPPVLHHFLLEGFPSPPAWFEARTAYTRSAAVSSIAGAVLGLGDRHTNNILLDLDTAEVVHIDLGIAFEQGLFLTTPERVPFRLTPNIVDAMGAAGVEGSFRRCSEVTLQARHVQHLLLQQCPCCAAFAPACLAAL